MPIIKTWIELGSNPGSSDWSEIKIDRCNVQMIFDKIKKGYFDKWLANVNCIVKWDLTNILSNDSNYKIFDGPNGREAFISINTLIRPRIQLLSVLLHILIHLHITTSSKGKISITYHGPEFKKLMHFFNERLDTKITTGHTFPYSEEENQYPNQWWQCTGICLNYQPFYGVIRCQTMPSEAMNFWSTHNSKCGGTFFKIFEAERHHGDGTVEKKYVRNVKYLNPRAKVEPTESNLPQKSHMKASHQVRAQIDLTDEEPQETNLCTVINLDESEFVINDSDEEENLNSCDIEDIIKYCNNVLKKCFLCQEIVGESRLASHLDSCTGFQQQVAFNPKKL